MPDLEVVKSKLLSDIQERFLNDRLKFDSEVGTLYFTNSPGDFLPWSKRNMEFTELEKAIIKEKIIGDVVFLNNMRWYLVGNTYRATEILINAAFN